MRVGPVRVRPVTPPLWEAWFAGAATTIFAIIFYLSARHRDLGYDEALSIGNFIATPSLLDPFRRQIVLNNHVLFSFLEHLIYRARGGWTAESMRVLPLFFAAATVALLSATMANRFGLLAGLGSGLVLATNAGFAFEATTVRGYTLLVLATVASTILLFDILRSADPGRWKIVMYVVAVAAGIATHLYMALVVLGHITIVGARGKMSKSWRDRWLIAGIAGILVYAGVIVGMLTAVGSGHLKSSLPSQLPGFFLGRPPAAAILIGVVVVVGILPYLVRRETKAVVVVYIAAFLLLWLAIQPRFLYLRFFLWAVPSVAVAVAAGISRQRALVLLLAAAVALEIVAQIPHRHDNQTPISLSGEVVAASVAAGRTVCVDPATRDALIVETSSFRTIRHVNELAGCDVFVVLQPGERSPVISAALAGYPLSYTLPAVSHGVAFSRSALPCRTQRGNGPAIIVAC